MVKVICLLLTTSSSTTKVRISERMAHALPILPAVFFGSVSPAAFPSERHFRLTNKTPAATYRSPGRYETNFVREQVMDAMATRKLGLSRVEVRRRNLISPEEMPYERPLVALGDEVVLDSGDYEGLLDKALARCDCG